ncbi:IclR family transcriptional regulator [Sphingomonas lacunae]|uniref:IclR family transcriptional regulator n=1 Tax=Sphingomonas lacunae TaxID=2698828 RepID=A0A6M4ATZ6_9SPHN|nr:IclR family transcriptional regulator [Sphingomonas lacunae]QJQ32587.1 IclR family transcriptional regulator [Sphingomonas lacunae]
MGLALAVVERVAEAQPIGASDLARRMDLPKATVHRVLLALEAYGWLERDGGVRPRWSVTVRPISIAGRAIEHKSGLRTAALSIMDALRAETGETVHLGLLQGEKILLIERIDGVKSVNIFLPVGTSWDLTWSSGGKAVLAHMPADQLAVFMQSPRYRRKSETDVIPPEELAAELAQIRRQGFAISVGGGASFSSSVGAPIFDSQGCALAGLSISGAANRLRERQLMELAPRVVEAARRINIGMALQT